MHACVQAPYEDLPWLFFGEEQHMLRHIWMAGYDMWAPPRSVAFHLWSRQGRTTLQECVRQASSLAS
jgi:[Skp1-protein]-hydroxyproline N-acetylglucosaminyltransferase